MLARTVPSRSLWICGLIACSALAACDDAAIGPPRTAPPAPPAAGNDPAFAVGDVALWNLVGDALTPGQDTLTLEVVAPADTDVIDVWVAGGPGQRLTAAGDHRFTGAVSIATLGPGEYDVLFAADGATTAFARAPFFRTHPMYFVVSTDWDFPEPGQAALDAHDQLRAAHPDIRFTQFVGPYTYTDTVVTEARKAEITTWLTTRRDQYDDEIALHIHPWCHFVAAAGIPCITDQSTVYQTDASGYTIKVSAYGQDDFETLLATADEIFMDHGLGKPVTFRAGGWTASVDTLKALAAQGYVADTSALNWARLEEWNRPPGSELYNWNMATWSTIGDTSQPYHPNVDDKQSPAAPHVPILEVPDNAIMVDYVSTLEMIEIFGANWPGPALTAPKVYMMGFHPSSSWTSEEFNRVDGILDHADLYRASEHAGPVVYAVLRDLPTVWPAP
ncbi:MAG: hypothetical protein IPL61_02715 [Myxococcales bacterium]|nr:hypothetical protein [Myxococcales bacterium]